MKDIQELDLEIVKEIQEEEEIIEMLPIKIMYVSIMYVWVFLNLV